MQKQISRSSGSRCRALWLAPAGLMLAGGLVVGPSADAQGTARATIYPGLPVHDIGITLGSWGSGTAKEDKDLVYKDGLESLKIDTHGLYQGVRISLARPVDLGTFTTDKNAYLQFIIALPETQPANSNLPGAGSFGGKFGGLGLPGAGGGTRGAGGRPGAGGPPGAPGGFGGPPGGFGGPPGAPGGFGGPPGLPGAGGGTRGGAGRGGFGGPPGAPGGFGGGPPGGFGGPPDAPGGFGGKAGGAGTNGNQQKVQRRTVPAKPIQNLRLQLVTSDNQTIDTMVPLIYAPMDGQWRLVDIPVAAIKGLPAGAQIKEVRLFGDQPSTLNIGAIRVVDDSTPITIDRMADAPAVPRNQAYRYTTMAHAGSTPLKYSWDFGTTPGQTVEERVGRSVTYTYFKPGDYTVTVTASDLYGIKPSATTTFKVHVTP